MTRDALGALLYVLVAPWIVDFTLFLVCVKFAGRKAPLIGVVLAYVFLNALVPLALVVRYMGTEWAAGVALIIIVRVVEFRFFSLHDSFRKLWVDQKKPLPE